MTLEPGMRVRCVDANHYMRSALVLGAEYTIRTVIDRGGASPMISTMEKPHYNFHAWRFKPIVRVKAPSRHI